MDTTGKAITYQVVFKVCFTGCYLKGLWKIPQSNLQGPKMKTEETSEIQLLRSGNGCEEKNLEV